MELLPLVIFIILFILATSIRTVKQGHVAVVTMFGKYRKVLSPGLNFVVPIFDRVQSRISIQNQTSQLQFQAITSDQANVHFTTTIIFTVSDHLEETIKLVAFKFVNDRAFTDALSASVESAVRAMVATKRQAEVLGLREEIVAHAKHNLDDQLAEWGYTLLDLSVNDIAFDQQITQSMAKVVAAKNDLLAAENEGLALKVRLTAEAEAKGAAIRISAENEAEAARLRGEGLAKFRTAIANGLAEASLQLKSNGVDPAIIAFAMWTETIRETAEKGQGNTLFLDGGVAGFEETMRRLQATVTPKK